MLNQNQITYYDEDNDDWEGVVNKKYQRDIIARLGDSPSSFYR